MMMLPLTAAEQEITVIASVTDVIDETSSELKAVITDSHYEIDNDGNVNMIVKIYIDVCYPFEAKAKMNDDGTICFVRSTGVTYFLKDVAS